jgi:hypothetical protein
VAVSNRVESHGAGVANLATTGTTGGSTLAGVEEPAAAAFSLQYAELHFRADVN